MLSKFLFLLRLRSLEKITKGVSTILIILFLLSCPSCSIFKGTTHDSEKSSAEFSESEIEDEPGSVFDSERKKQKDLAEMVAKTGSQNKKKKVRPGDDFLLSDKAKEIYANTER